MPQIHGTTLPAELLALAGQLTETPRGTPVVIPASIVQQIDSSFRQSLSEQLAQSRQFERNLPLDSLNLLLR